MTKAKKIEKFIRDCFEEFSINYREFFSYYELDNEDEPGYWIETSWENDDGSVNMDAVSHASIILGISEEDILTTKEEAIMGWLKKFPYYRFVKPFRFAYEKSFYGKGYDEIHLIEAIFDVKSNQPYPTRYDYTSVKNRLIEQLKEIGSSFPGAYHEGSSISNLKILTKNFCSFEEIENMTNSYISMIVRAKELFIAAVSHQLKDEDVYEYNLLVSTLGIRDRYYTKGYLYYDELKKARGYFVNVTDDNFYDSIVLTHGLDFEPWKCSGFINNDELVRRYIITLPESKAVMGRYSMEVSQFLCLYRWDDSIAQDISAEDAIYLHSLCDDFDVPEDERQALPERFYIAKTDDELGEDKDTSKRLSVIVRPKTLGGVDVKAPKVSTEISVQHIQGLLGKVLSSNFIERSFDNFGNNSSFAGGSGDE